MNNKTHHLIGDGYIDSGDNTFTVIIGKNGTGKSKLLHKIADTLTNSYNNNQKFNSSSSSLMRSLEFRKKEQPYQIVIYSKSVYVYQQVHLINFLFIILKVIK